MAGTWAAAFSLPPDLVRAHIMVESGGDPYAFRIEVAYRYLWDNRLNRPFRELTEAEIASAVPPGDFTAPAALPESRNSEWWAQRASWGPMQVMGAEARSKGFTGNMPALCDSDGSAGIHYGCLRLKQLADLYLAKYGWKAVSAAYNAGHPSFLADKSFENQEYVDRIAAAGGFNVL